MAAPRVFVSHSHQDDAFTQRLVDDLKAAGADVWVDIAGVGADDFLKRINQALASCDTFVLVVTPTSLASAWVEIEVNAAIRLKLQGRMQAIIQLIAEPVDQTAIPPTWGTFNHFDASRDYPAARNRVLGVLGLSPHSDPPHQAPAPQQPQDMAPVRVPRPHVSPASPGTPPTQGRLPKRLASLGYEGCTIKGTLVILPPLCTVPAGEFFMGSDKGQDREADDSELPQHQVTLAAFQIARFPVTVAEYACFLRARRMQADTRQPQRRKLDHPAMSLSWHDAIAYAFWLSEQTELPWRLPTEAEWEKAARWDSRTSVVRTYPWGDAFDKDRCNTAVGGLGGTTAVGHYPSDTSPYGAHDMAGNVWEWTSSLFKPYPYRHDDGRETLYSTEERVLRGGSWYLDAKFARSAYRLYDRPDDVNGYLGFRLALTPTGP